MNYRKLMVAMCSASFVFFAMLATSAENDGLTMRDAISSTLEKNPQFRTYQLRNEALLGERRTAELKPALRISTEVENIIGTGDLKWFHGTELTLALSQIIELGDKRAARTEIVSRRQSVLRAEQRVLELELLAETATRFIELAATQQHLDLLIRATGLTREILESVSERVNVGRAPEAERARATAAMRRAELAEESARFNIAAARVRLSSLWGELQPNFGSVEANLLEVEELAPIQNLLEQLERNPAIQVFASESRLRTAQLREARSRRQADIEVGAGIRHLAELNDTALTFQISMPLLSKTRAGGAITTAQASLLAVDSERETALLKMSAQLLVLDQQRRLALNEVSVLQAGVLPQLESALDETREAFDSGRYSYVELTAAQRDLLDSEFALIEAATRAHLLRVEIERFSGEALEEFTGDNRQ